MLFAERFDLEDIHEFWLENLFFSSGASEAMGSTRFFSTTIFLSGFLAISHQHNTPQTFETNDLKLVQILCPLDMSGFGYPYGCG